MNKKSVLADPMNSFAFVEGALGIAAVERDTGISKDLLRVWERRYGFPQPSRDLQGERAYPPEQVQRLRLLRRVLAAGHRPGRVVACDEPALHLLLQASGATQQAHIGPATGSTPEGPALADSVAGLNCYVDLLRQHDFEGLRRELAQEIARNGLRAAVVDLIAPLNTLVGELWMRGELKIFEEHIYTETLQRVLRQALQAIPSAAPAARPRVLLTTLPGESHGLGLLMVEALLTLEGCPCLSLGVQTPLDEIAGAAAAQRADVVGLSFSGFLPAGVVLRGLAQVRAALPASLEVWAGGRAPALRRRAGPAGVHCMTALGDLAEGVARWRLAGPLPAIATPASP